MYTIVLSKRYRKSIVRLIKGGLKPSVRENIDRTLITLAQGAVLDSGYRDHALKGDYIGCRECHIKGDLLLVYEKIESLLILRAIDIGSHSELFE